MSVAVHLEEISLPLFQMYSRCCTLHTGRAHVRPAIPAVLDLVAQGRFNPDLVTTAEVAWDDSREALLRAPLKLVVVR